MYSRTMMIVVFLLCAGSFLAQDASAIYSPKMGRFLARDPIGYEDGENLYVAYFVPSGVDPSGLHTGPVTFPWGKPRNLPGPPPSRCVRYFIGYTPTGSTGQSAQDCLAKVASSKHVSICMKDCKTGRIRTGHHGRGGASNCNMAGTKFCEIKRKTSGVLGDGSGIGCDAATDADIARCLLAIPDLPGDYANLTKNCHGDVANRASKCCLTYSQCVQIMPSCLWQGW